MLAVTVILFTYFATILLLIHGFSKIKTFDNLDLKPKTAFSIIVPFRNEAENLPILLESLSQLNYPTNLFEVILVDDQSTDEFQIPVPVAIGIRFQISVINNIRKSNSPKKDAITTAIKHIKNNWIISTDADCVVPENWLLSLDNYIQNQKPEMIAGAVKYSGDHSFLHYFQQLDLASLQGATIGSFGLSKGFMCNGANLTYTKSLFEKLNGFEGNNKIASGDDVFLLQKAINSPNFGTEKVHYLKSENHIVTTKPLDNWKDLFYQRVRWASKTTSYQSNFGKALGLIVFGGNISLWFVLWNFCFGNGNQYLLSFLLLTKLSVDFLLIYKTNVFLKSKTQSYLTASILYPFFSISVALYALVGKYEWKGRKFQT